MIIGVPKEIKEGEFRVAATPMAVAALVSRGHEVLVETSAGEAAGFADEDFRAAGAEIVADARAAFQGAEMLYKVKEILAPEYELLRDRQILFTYIHSANKPEQTQILLDKKVAGIAYEDVETDDGDFPLLNPMSEIAGEVGMLLGVHHLFTTAGGSGILIGGSPGIAPAKVAVVGAGHVGIGAARYAAGLGAEVILLDVDVARLREVRRSVLPNVKTLYSSRGNIEKLLPEVDVLVNAVKWRPGMTIVSRDMLALMKRRALIVDVDCEPGGGIETCAYTTHEEPILEVDGVRHICVPNLPSAVARTGSEALCNVTLPYAIEIADKGWLRAVKENRALRRGLGFAYGYLTFRPTADAQGRPHTPPEKAIELIEAA
jgi:alanine dehydrogenase